ncbi:unnamed protein product, partial [Aphanomyces euteiches]
MGIRGLTAYVAERQAECADEIEDLKNVTLGVDLDSFLHFACRELVNGYNAQWLLLGGDARALYVWVRTWMRPLFSRKIRLKFVRDPPGMLNTIKDVTHVKRSKEKADKMLSVQNGLNDKTGPKDDPWQTLQIKDDVAKTLVEAQAVFTLARQTLVRCLQHAGCSIVTASTEADETLGDMVRSKKIYAVLAHDSDYLMMHKMRYIPFNSIRVNAESGVVSATVFIAEKLAACTSLAPDKLIEWAIVCGNDFTPYVDQHFGLAEKLHLPLLRQSQGYFNVGDALMWLQEHVDDPVFHELLKNNPDLLTHVYGIYCFYGAGDIVKSRFPSATRHKPRRVAAITLATTVAKMREQTVGQTIGYRVGQIQKDSDETQITYVTTGYMLERLVHNAESVSRVTHLILDEAHERSMDMDMLLLMLATHWHMWSDLKLIIMSATMDSSIFFKYFKPKLPYPLKQKEELFVGSALHPVRSIYLEDMKGMKELKVGKLVESLNSWARADMNDIEVVIKKLQNIVNPQLELCVRIAKMIVDTQKGTGCILIFVSGLTDIQFLHEQFEKWSSIKLFVLHSDIELDDQAKVFEGVDRKTKIILSTNIAESSVTIPDVTHIINTGLEKQIVMHSQSHSEILVRSWCSRASVKQRSGRAGRIQPGVAYHLFTKQFMETCMDEYTTPELLRKPLDKVVLQLKSQLHHIGTPTELLSKAISVPDLANIQSAFNVLHLFSAVESPNEKDAITSFGAFSVHFPLDIRLCRLLMYGLSASDWGIGVVDVVLLVAVMASPDLHLAPSRFHTPSAAKYLNDMKLSLVAKLDLQEGNVWSESLAMWQLMVQCLTCKSKGEVISLLKNFAISFRRFQTTLVLVGEICSRLMRLAKTPQYKNIRVLNVAAIKQLSLLQKFSARMYSPEPWKYSHAPLPIMRLLIVLNYSDCLARGRLPDNKKGESKGKKDSEPLLSLALKVDSSCAWGTNIPAHHFKKLLDALVREPEDMNVVKGSSLFDIKYRQSNPVPFSASLLYFLRDRRFPVDLPVDPLWKPAVGDPDALRVRFTDAGFRPGGVLSWTQWTSGIKLNVSGRSVFGLPQAKLQKKVVAAIFSEQLLTGDGSMMMCGGCTMLPPDVESYAAIVMLMTAKRNVWIFVDSKLQYWSAIKVDGCNCSLDDCVALHPTLDTINLVRRELSRGLVQSLPTARDPVARISGEDMDALFKTDKKKLDGMKWIQLDFDTSTKLPFPPLV